MRNSGLVFILISLIAALTATADSKGTPWPFGSETTLNGVSASGGFPCSIELNASQKFREVGVDLIHQVRSAPNGEGFSDWIVTLVVSRVTSLNGSPLMWVTPNGERVAVTKNGGFIYRGITWQCERQNESLILRSKVGWWLEYQCGLLTKIGNGPRKIIVVERNTASHEDTLSFEGEKVQISYDDTGAVSNIFCAGDSIAIRYDGDGQLSEVSSSHGILARTGYDKNLLASVQSLGALVTDIRWRLMPSESPLSMESKVIEMEGWHYDYHRTKTTLTVVAKKAGAGEKVWFEDVFEKNVRILAQKPSFIWRTW